MAGRLLHVPWRAAVRVLACAVVAVPVFGTAGALAAPTTAADAQADLDAVSARLIEIRSKLDLASPEERVELLREQRKLEDRKGEAAEVANDAEVEAAEEAARAEAERAAEEAAQAPRTGALPVPLQIPAPGAAPAASLSGDDAALGSSIDGYLAGKTSPLTGLGAVFVAESRAVGLDPRFLVAISGGETSFGTYGPAQRIHNPFGMGPHIVYPSWEASIRAAAQNLGGRLYKGDGRVTIDAIQSRWAPVGAGNDPTNLNSNWQGTIGRFYAEQGGNPTGSVFTDTGGSAAVVTPVPGVQVATQVAAAPLAQGPAAAVQGGGTGVGPAVAQEALAYLGTPYLWGGERPETGFDCSGFVQFLYERRGVILPRVAEDQAAVGVPVPPQALQAGDAIFFADSTGYIHHEGMYLGDGYFIHAPRTGDVVKISSLYESYYAGQYAGARRY